MGQYHHLICPETGTHLAPHDLAAYRKALEQFGSAIPSALAFLMATTNEAHPRDLPWAPKGKWAGFSPIVVGDYATEFDLVGYDHVLPAHEPDLFNNIYDDQIPCDASLRRSKKLKNISIAILPILERVFSERAKGFNKDGVPNSNFNDFVAVKKTPDGSWTIDYKDMDAEAIEATNNYFERISSEMPNILRDPIVIRKCHFTPLGPIPDEIPDPSLGLGDRLLWVNLDRQEYIDPEKIGDIPDLSGVIRGDSARVVFAMLCFHENRGGGDFNSFTPANIPGRWRGDRIVLLGSKPFKPKKSPSISQSDVQSAFSDISSNARFFLLQTDEIRDDIVEVGSFKTSPQRIEAKIHSLLYNNLNLRKILERLDIRITPPSKVTFMSNKNQEEFCLKPSLDLFFDNGKMRIPPELCSDINQLLSSLPPMTITLYDDKSLGAQGKQNNQYSLSSILKTRGPCLSNHQLIESA